MLKASEINHVEILGRLKAAHEILNDVKGFSDLPHRTEILVAKHAVLKAMEIHWDFINQYISEDDT